jgi:hypothetical protein
MTGRPDTAPGLPASGALAAVTGSAIVLGVAGVTAPLAWFSIPVALCGVLRVRAALLVVGWGGLCIWISVLVPFVPGHEADQLALAASFTALAAGPLLAWHQQRRAAAGGGGGGGGGDGSVSGDDVGTGDRAVLLLGGDHEAIVWEGDPWQVVAWTPDGVGGARVLIGELQGDVADPTEVLAAVQSRFSFEAAWPDRGLPEVARRMDVFLAEVAPDGWLAATLVELPASGLVQLVCRGAPSPVLRWPDGTVEAADRWLSCPLGLQPRGPTPVKIPPGARVAVVTDALLRDRCAGGDWVEYVGMALETGGLLTAARKLAGGAAVVVVGAADVR